MATRRWQVRPFQASSDLAGVMKLWSQVAGFDGGVPAMTGELLDAWLAHPAQRGGEAWRVVTSSSGAVVGAMMVGFPGSLRTSVDIAVNPAFRRQGIGRALIAEAPPRRRLVSTSRATIPGATALFEGAAFTERHRSIVFRRGARGLTPPSPPEGAEIVDDKRGDARRAILAMTRAFGEDADDDRAFMRARLSRTGSRIVYLRIGDEDRGVALVAGCERARKGERDSAGEPKIGFVEAVGLDRGTRGKGLSRSLVRAALQAVADLGYEEIEVVADARRQAALELYEKEGFRRVDEEIHWMRAER